MSNDLRIGLSCGVACVFAVAILFFQKPTAPGSPPAAKVPVVATEATKPVTASIPGGPLPRPVKALSNPLP